MNFPWSKPKLPYDMDEVADQIGALAHLNKLRDAALQKAVLYQGSDVKQQRYLEEVDRYDDMIKVTQLVYEFMVDEVAAYNKHMKQKQLKQAGK